MVAMSLISVEQVAELLGVSSCTLYRQRKKWGLKGYRIGKRLMFRVREIEAWIDSQAC